ncbi:MAG: DUF4416 family protein [Endomicrobiales bacterium]|nr:DUF4416 family protein [Endomicrobiales bacterium]
MGTINSAEPVKLFLGIIAVSSEIIAKTEPVFEEKWGKIDLKSELIPFKFTDYYEKEMGKNLFRQWFSFEKLIQPGFLADIKIETNKIEESLSASGKRQINVDPGYLALSKIILASTKDFSHRIYLSGGIYSEITLMYKNKKYESLPWTYPDYYSDIAKSYFSNVRKIYGKQLSNSL